MSAKSIAIDGPAGAGKSTIAKKLAAEAGLIYVDTGAMYRTLGLACLRAGADTTVCEQVLPAMEKTEISLDYIDGTQHVFLNGEDVSSEIRREEVSHLASTVSVHPPVRERLVKMQQELAASRAVVMDGRDIGTVVLPNAFLKIFLTASVEERARRRKKDYEAMGKDVPLSEVEAEIRERDDRDRNRPVGPLKQAEDAVRVDTTGHSIEEVCDIIRKLYREKAGE